MSMPVGRTDGSLVPGAANGRPAAPSSLDACLAEWEADHDDLHGYAAMRNELDRHFTERFFSWMPYLHGELGEVDAEEERAHRGGRDPSYGLSLRR
jgi:hypothetical protein